MKTILITGASGFLGDKIFDSLSSLNEYKLVLGVRDPSKISGIDKFKNAEIRYFNLVDDATYFQALVGVDAVVHLAAMDYADCEKNPELAWKVNVNLLEAFFLKCKESGVKQFVYFSTFHVYGPSLEGVITEETVTNPVNNYSKTHLEAEKIVLSNLGIEGIVVRLSNAIGKPLHADSSAWKLVVNDLCKQAVTSRKIVLQSTGKQLRDFIPASVVGFAIDTILEKNSTINASAIYNLGSGKSLSILDIVKIIQKECQDLYQFTPTFETRENTTEKISSFHFSVKKLSQLGFVCSTTIKKEIGEILLSINN
ncbi:MAG: SDR family oxidoreductase [Bacteriovorax sp.]|nr:SDR family oxidoreductase [Bacteriovorax sp.]